MSWSPAPHPGRAADRLGAFLDKLLASRLEVDVRNRGKRRIDCTGNACSKGRRIEDEPVMQLSQGRAIR
jgi:hypothetical protein